MDITFYYARQPRALNHLRNQCTIWLPETESSEPQTLWQPNQVIATSDLSYLFRLRDMIQAGTILPEKVIWIEIKNLTATGYVFDKDGKINNFFRII